MCFIFLNFFLCFSFLWITLLKEPGYALRGLLFKHICSIVGRGLLFPIAGYKLTFPTSTSIQFIFITLQLQLHFDYGFATQSVIIMAMNIFNMAMNICSA